MTLKISTLSKRLDDKWILRDVSFEVAGSEIFGLIGENAAETSAVLQIIGNAKTSDAAKISLDGKRIAEKDVTIFPPPCKKDFWQNLFLQKNRRDFSESNSESEKYKTAFENLLNEAEKVVLLENPFACFDENLYDELFARLKKTVKKKNLRVVLVANRNQEIFGLCDRVGVLKNGEIIQTGTPRELYEKPNSVLAARALGRCNFIKAMRVSFTNQRSQEFQTLDGEHRLQTDKSEKGILGAINQPVTLAVRPEHISISFGASFPEDNLLKAKIADVQYLGATTRIILDAEGLKLEALVLRLVGLKTGDECMVGLPPDRIRVLKD